MISPRDASVPALSARSVAAVAALRVTNWLSRSLGRGGGTVAGGRVGLAVDPTLLTALARGRRVALVTGTNGKTTTTRLLVAALSGAGEPAVASNATGANMPAGHVAALAGTASGTPAVLEVDEGYLDRVITETEPRVVILLNLSRDQLDRISEVRMLVERWRQALGRLDAPSDDAGPGTVVVANADDPMVAWAAMAAPEVRWVGAGQVWRLDAVGCPSCGGRIVFDDVGRWACDRCTFARPEPEAWLEGPELVLADGGRLPVALGLPGQFNRANAAMVAFAAPVMAGTPDTAAAPPSPRASEAAPSTADWEAVADILARLSEVDQVAGRFSSMVRHGRSVRLLLAKNPAGWTAIFDLLDEEPGNAAPVVLSVNARTADGFDTSWLWDVPFERLAGRQTVATGERRLDLAVRLRYAGVATTVVADPLAAVDAAVHNAAAADAAEADAAADQLLPVDVAVGPLPASAATGRAIDFVGNYTAFADIRSRA